MGARYQYQLVWAALLVGLFTWIIISEIGRYTVVSGNTVLHGYEQLPGPGKWPVWLMFGAQILDLGATVAGHAALSAVVLLLALPGSEPTYAIALIVLAAVIVIGSALQKVSRASAVLAFVLLTAALFTVSQVFPGFGTVASGFVPGRPQNANLYFVLPWVGFLLIHGAPWFSYWSGRQGFGGELRYPLDERAVGEAENSDSRPNEGGDSQESGQREDRLHSWWRLMVRDAGIGNGIGLLMALSFVTLGAEILGGGAVPSGPAVGRQLASGLRSWLGPLGFWLFVLTAGGSFWTHVLDVSDGATRLLADGTLILLPDRFVQDANHTAPGSEPSTEQSANDAERAAPAAEWGRSAGVTGDAGEEDDVGKAGDAGKAGDVGKAGDAGRAGNVETAADGDGAQVAGGTSSPREWLLQRHHLVSAYVVVFATVVPIGLILLVRNPMQILAFAGIVSAAQAPFYAAFTLWANRRLLPREYRPGPVWSAGLALGALFFGTATTLYFLGLLGFKLF
ncbi:MAG: Nramp family divalent metal transporter [Salinigranum sp.]